MKILYCNKYNFPFSGTEKYLFEVMDLMRSAGHETALFSMADRRGSRTQYDRYLLPQANFKDNTLNLWKRAQLAGRAIYSWEARMRLREMIADFQPDVAHVRNIYHHLSPSILWELNAQRVPVVYHLNDFKVLCPNYNLVSHGGICERCTGGAFWHVVTERCYAGGGAASLVLAAEAYTHKWLRTYQRCVDVFLAPSQFVKDKLVEHGWDSGRIQVLSHFQQLPLERASEPGDDAPMLYFGRLSAEKGVADLLRAMQRLPQIRLRIAGDGPQKEELLQLTSRLGLNNVEFSGHLGQEDLRRAIASSRFTVFPSHAYETFGKSILESYAEARAVIASDLGSRRELVREDQTGVLYPVGNVDALAQAIASLWSHPDRVVKMGQNAREFVSAHYSPERHHDSLYQIYQRLAVSKPRPLQGEREALRVAFIGGRGVISKYSGIETYYEEVGRALAAKGHRVTVYCRSYFTPQQRFYAGMELVRLPAFRSKHLETLTHTFLSTVHAIFGKYDIVHFHALGPALFSCFPRMIGKKTAVTVQGLDWQRRKWGIVASWVLQMGERAAVRFPDATMTVSQTLREHYKTRLGANAVYIPNGAVIRQAGGGRNLAGWGLEQGQYILFLGRFSPEKNCHLLISAYEKLHTSVKLVLAGGSSHSDKYVAELRRHERDNIVLLDWVSGNALDELLTNAMLFVLPSDMEGLSLALLDAMGAGVCVLASDIPENLEVVADAGYSFRKGDVNDLARMMEMLIVNPELRKKAASMARQRISVAYQWRTIADQIEQVYLAMLQRPQAIPERMPESLKSKAA